MDPRFSVSREELYTLHMELKQVQYTQTNHTERILRLEKRNADDANLKSVWNSPFPGVVGGTPQQVPHSDMFDDLDEQGEQLLGSLHLGPAEEEPVRRGAASRANSVRFDESALHGSGWAGQAGRQSGELGPVRPGSGLMMERSLSHKSDGRHSSAGHSVHSGRASSLGLDMAADDDSSSYDMPVSLYVLGSVPSIVRCWLTTNYAHDTLLYADVCTGSQKSTVDHSLVRELGLLDEVERDVDGVCRARLSVYLAEAVVTHHHSRNGTPDGSVPSMTVAFEVTGAMTDQVVVDTKAIRIYIGSDALRAYSADVLFSQNKMVLLGNERDRLQVPFVRPEDDAVFRHICTANVAPEKAKLNANATPFVVAPRREEEEEEGRGLVSPTKPQDGAPPEGGEATVSGSESDKMEDANGDTAASTMTTTTTSTTVMTPVKEGLNGPDASRRESSSSSGIWGSWRQGSSGEASSLSSYQPASRTSRNMKVLRPHRHKSSPSAAPHESPSSSKTQLPPPQQQQQQQQQQQREEESRRRVEGVNGGRRGGRALPRSVNPVGTASAFSWMTPVGKGG
ncbi:hypothetical protein CDD80_803 [Ophiocordyceps camponoti-rufipedis]|uniref:Ubiquitin carboxyl-terminal hydrolase 19 n=1 Tax=Ophiocordyceps camponoti-rufipedis TaxID=2004952 RepID=A0A2C5YKF1_9HYPO|nr:hypothetical protein CDD80_803 [Ophiocordyceps camponoti-rufipedis]